MYNESENVMGSAGTTSEGERSSGGSVSGSSLASKYQVSNIFLHPPVTRSCFVANCNLSPTRFPTALNIWEVEGHQ